MPQSSRFRINTPTVIEQTVDDETLIVHLERGHYFSLRGSAQEIWSALVAGTPTDHLVAGLAARYTATDDAITAAVEAFCKELLADQLVVADSDPAPAEARGPSPEAREALPFQPPVLTRYTDIEDMLLIDPIHEVDETGWPRNTPA
jgi:hypothetical protein